MELLKSAHNLVIEHKIVEDTNGAIVHVKLSGGHVYKGPITMDGSASYQWNDGTSYDGDFQNGEMTGFGVYKFKDSTYNGHVYCGIRHGYGSLIIHDTNTKYIGEWSNGKREGSGTCIYNNGDRYVGEWTNDCKNGYGVMRWNSLNEIYCGQWKDDKPHGNGVYVMFACASNDNITMDRITMEQLEGLHNFSCFNGLNWYHGEWKEGKRDGFGIHNYANGAQYKGQWLQNKKHGKAEYIYENAARFIGEFENDQQKECSESMQKKISKHFVIRLDDNQTNMNVDEMYKIMLRHWKSLQNIFPSLCTLSNLWILIDVMKLKQSQSLYDLNKYIASYTIYPNHTCNISNPNHRFLFREFNEILIKLSMFSEHDFEECVLNVIQFSPQIANRSLTEYFWQQLSTPYKELWTNEECKTLFEKRYEESVTKISSIENINENSSATYVSGSSLKQILEDVITEPVIQSMMLKEFENCYYLNTTTISQPLIVQSHDMKMNLDSMRFLPHECRLFFVVLICIKVAYDEMLNKKEEERLQKEEEIKLEIDAQAKQKGKKSKKDQKKKEEEQDSVPLQEDKNDLIEEMQLIQIEPTHIEKYMID